ncbi:MAG: acyl-CoA dehydrogenase [Paucimonas sp.]|nr:acyl-CoA dehydrogenase [Paucimonas sp.]
MASEAFDLTLLKQWAGKTEVMNDVVDAGKMHALAATLDREPPADGMLPPLWHWTHFWPIAPASQIGEDGHPRRGGFLPPVPLPRRMWAGGRLQFRQALPAGAAISRKSTILDVNAKSGSSGQLAFVTVRHEVSAKGEIALTEEHDIVYRDLPPPGAKPAPGRPAPGGEAWSREIVPDPVLLFRYSALTFNGHRIHYDRSYVTEVEGYPGLIVHGPLIATLLVDLLQRNLPQAKLVDFSFRAVGPLFDIEPFTVCGLPQDDGKTVQLWAKNVRGELAMQAEATIA